MKKIKILDIGDMQNGFIRKYGNLYIEGAEDIIGPANKFLRQVRSDVFDFILVILDTHFSEEYFSSQESKMFPIHCEYGTKDWELAIDLPGFPNINYLMKNQFNMWSEKSTPHIAFNDPKRRSAYDNLFCFVNNTNEPVNIISRDEFIKSISYGRTPADVEITIFGVASDYCNLFAMDGWLERGFSVTIIEDLTKGIKEETKQILDDKKYQQYQKNRLRCINSDEYLREKTQ